MAASEQLTLEHRADRSRFVINTPVGQAHVDYRIEVDLLCVHNTFVPQALRGRGIAAQLTEAVLAYCRQERLALRPLCSYTASYLKRHPQDDVNIRA